MGDQGESRPQAQGGPSAMTEMEEALPKVTSSIPSTPLSTSTITQHKYQRSHATIPQPQPSVGGLSPAYPTGPDKPYYSHSLGQQIDPSSTGYQYGGQAVGFRNSPASIPVAVPQFPQSHMQQQAFNLPRYQYPQQYPLQLGRARSIPSYTISPQSQNHPQFLQTTLQYPVYATPSFPPNFSSAVFSDETSPSASDPENLVPHGPPRKPKQSGFALWVGNLPRDVLLEELKEFFALEGLESIFLIRKSNCAFVNYRTEEACSLALSIFNDKLFKNVRLVCRLRKSSPTRTSTGPAHMTSASSSIQTVVHSDTPSIPNVSSLSENVVDFKDSKSAKDNSPSSFTTANAPQKNRYFIMKSLAKEDLGWSVANKVWATQPHNEGVLNDAFRTSDNVYLIFSVNKSGEFFGYARMASEISESSAAEAPSGQEKRNETISERPVALAGPKAKITPRTSAAPRGKIFEDDVRGTLFWEVAESSDDDEEETEGDQAKPANKWGNSFRIDWIKWDASLQFQRTRLLRNPWNGNREVKISRDGTEIEPSVGARLLKEFEAKPTVVLGNVMPSARRMSYPIAPTNQSPQIMYQQQTPQMSMHGVTYLPYGSVPATQTIIVNYAQPRAAPQQPPQNFGGSGQQYPYGPPPQ